MLHEPCQFLHPTKTGSFRRNGLQSSSPRALQFAQRCAHHGEGTKTIIDSHHRWFKQLSCVEAECIGSSFADGAHHIDNCVISVTAFTYKNACDFALVHKVQDDRVDVTISITQRIREALPVPIPPLSRKQLEQSLYIIVFD